MRRWGPSRMGDPSASTFSSKVTRADSVRLSRVLRTISQRHPGQRRQQAWSFSRHARDFPVPAGPETSTSGLRSVQSFKGAPRGLYRRPASERVGVSDDIVFLADLCYLDAI